MIGNYYKQVSSFLDFVISDNKADLYGEVAVLFSTVKVNQRESSIFWLPVYGNSLMIKFEIAKVLILRFAI